MINAIVLAAGESRRMGRTKALLPFGKISFIEHIISVIKSSDVNRISIVLGADAELITKTADLSGTDVVINKDYKQGQLSSLIAVDSQPLVHPVGQKSLSIFVLENFLINVI